MVSTLQRVILLAAILALMSASVSANYSRPPRNNDYANVADALKYLQDLDNYYGDKSRVRFGKRASLMHMMRSHLNNEAELNRPLDMSNVEEAF